VKLVSEGAEELLNSRDIDSISGCSFLSAACLSFACLSADRDADRFRHRQGGIMVCVTGIPSPDSEFLGRENHMHVSLQDLTPYFPLCQ